MRRIGAIRGFFRGALGLFLIGLVGGWLGGCQTIVPVGTPSPTVVATPTLRATAVATPIPDSGWQLLGDGLERRTINQAEYSLYLLRLEPDLFDWRIAYRPGEPQTMASWQAESGALIVMNGGYFTEAFMATGLIVVDGQVSGIGYGDFAGMLTVQGGVPDLRWLAQRPFQPNEPVQYALQSFPLLVKPGGVLGYPDEDGKIARRTVIGKDGNGRFLLIAVINPGMTLHQLSQWLTHSDLALDIAVNLDGGTSTGLLLADPVEGVWGVTAVPVAITIYPK